jgi:phosphomevalonate kinase
MEYYSLIKNTKNGNTTVREVASKYNGKELKILQNINGDIQYETLSNGDLLNKIGHMNHSHGNLIKRLRSLRKTTKHHRRDRHTYKRKTTSNKTTLPLYKSKTRTRTRNASKMQSRSRKTRSKTRSKRPIPDIMKTIY